MKLDKVAPIDPKLLLNQNNSQRVITYNQFPEGDPKEGKKISDRIIKLLNEIK